MSEVGQGIDHSGDGLDVESSSRRAFLTAVSVVGLDVVAGAAANPVWAEPASDRPKEGDVLVSIESESPVPLEPKDIPAGGPQVMAWPMDPAAKVVRKGSRLNKVLLVRLDPATLVGVTRERAAEGVVAYSAICPHAGCEVSVWAAEQKTLECSCHYSHYRSARGRSRDRRSDAARACGASAQARRRQARGGKAVHRTRRHRADLKSGHQASPAFIRYLPERNSTKHSERQGRIERPAQQAQFRERERRRRHDRYQDIRAKRVCGAARQLAAGLSAQMPTDRGAGLGHADAGTDAGGAQKYTPVTAERLKKPEDGNWFQFRRTYDGWGYSPLNEITAKNVGRLQPVWSWRPARSRAIRRRRS